MNRPPNGVNASAASPVSPAMPSVLVYTQRERGRAFAKAAFPRRRTKVLLARSIADLDTAFKTNLIDAAIIDITAAQEDTWRAASRAREYPTVPFFGLAALRAAEGPSLAQCATFEFADVLVDGVDDTVARDIVGRVCYTSRFAQALHDPPPALDMTTPLQRTAWRFIVSHAGRPLRTSSLASVLNVTREHLSRTFAAEGAPNLKRIIDLVRIVSAAELSKNPGYDARDVAHILGFASSSHLSSTAMRVVGTKPASLARLRTVDLIERFSKGHGRSRGS